jgi:hypothetical protein
MKNAFKQALVGAGAVYLTQPVEGHRHGMRLLVKVFAYMQLAKHARNKANPYCRVGAPSTMAG